MSEGKKEETVQQHVERTMHGLLTLIDSDIASIVRGGSADQIKTLAEAFASLSCWPKEYMTPEQHRQLAEYEVEKALKRREGSA